MGDECEALRWISDLMGRIGVPFQAVGGLAARAYGATRPLVDLDFYVPTSRLVDVAALAGALVVRTPTPYADDHWDLTFMKIQYGDWMIELGGADEARYFDQLARCWREADIRFHRSVPRVMCGVSVPVMPLDQLVAYKRRLDRAVDQEDVAQLLIAQSLSH
jgi:hypothetical protein